MSDALDESPPARAEAALARTADCLVPLDPGGYRGLSGAELDRETAELCSLLNTEPGTSGTSGTVARLEARLGTLLALRHVLAGAPEDRAAALPLLETARVSELLSEAERTAALRDLMLLLLSRATALTRLMDGSGGLTLERIEELVRAGKSLDEGGPGTVEDAQRLFRLAEEANLLDRLPVPMLDLLRLSGLGDTGEPADFRSLAEAAQRLRETAPEMVPEWLRPILYTGLPLMQGLFTPVSPGPAPSGPGPSEASAENAILLEFLGLLGIAEPGALPDGEREKILGRLSGGGHGGTPLSSRMSAAMMHISEGLRTGEREHFRTSLRLLQEAGGAGEISSSGETEWLQAVVSGLFTAATATGGSLQDEDAADAFLAGVLPQALPGDPHLTTMRVSATCLRIRNDVAKAQETGDLAALTPLIEELLDLEYDVPGVLPWVSVFVSFTLGSAYLTRALLSGEPGDLRKAVVHLEEALEAPVELPVLRDLLDATWAPLLTLTATLESDPDLIVEGIRRTRSVLDRPGFTFDFEAQVRKALALALNALYTRTGDLTALDEAVAELEQACGTLPPEGSPGSAALYWDLAQLRADRADATGAAGDLRAAVSTARASLRATADDVLLQLGVRHGLRMARQGADRGRAAAFWALRAGRVDEAIGCLEAGRSLVLGAAAESKGVADRLESLGAAGLAAHWREAVPTPLPSGPEEGASPLDILSRVTGGVPELPGDVRRTALDLLRAQRERADAPPDETVTALRTGLARSGVDALVHLLPGTGPADGAVLLVTPGGPARAVPLAGLSAEGRAPIAAFTEATAERQRTAGAPWGTVSPQEERRVERRWRTAFDQVCDWAGGVLSPVLDGLGLWERALAESGLGAAPADGGPALEAVRLVLVPCGDLGLVPWPAATLRPPADGSGRETVRACELAVFSHAASGREFLRAAARTRMAPRERVALVYHGDEALAWAEEEIALLHEVYYPDAENYSDDGETAVAPATPSTVLSLLGGHAEAPASLVHLSCHGVAGPDPTTSALRLAPGEEAARAGETDQPLTLTTLLEAPHDGEAYRSRGPLVVCGACETDFTTRDHDEALTVTSVLVHRLATDAIGSRWAVDDRDSEILMLVLHDRITAGLAPPDALRAAQRWMLTEPGRRPPVRALARTPALRRWAKDSGESDAWAAFVHHGNPSGGVRP